MTKTILITGSTDGIGLETAKVLVGQGHKVLIHGRSESKLESVKNMLSSAENGHSVEIYRADLSKLSDVEALADQIKAKHQTLDVIINNAGVFKALNPITSKGQDIRFVVNTIAPYLLTKRLLPLLNSQGRVVNLSSAAQAPVDLGSLQGNGRRLNDNQAYAQSKLALTMWSFQMAQTLADKGPVIVAVNPASLLGSKMVKDAYGVEGADLAVGADILVRAALSDEFTDASGRYFDNDHSQFADPHPDALDPVKNQAIVDTIESVLVEAGK